jgi:hypothetical protein
LSVYCFHSVTLKVFIEFTFRRILPCEIITDTLEVFLFLDAAPTLIIESHYVQYSSPPYYKFLFLIITEISAKIGARGSVVVKALCYKPEGRGL